MLLFSPERGDCCEGARMESAGSFSAPLLPGFGKCLLLLRAAAAFAGVSLSAQGGRQPGRQPPARLPVLCVTLVTLGSRCLGFPTCWAEIGLLAESARVLMRGLGRLGHRARLFVTGS